MLPAEDELTEFEKSRRRFLGLCLMAGATTVALSGVTLAQGPTAPALSVNGKRFPLPPDPRTTVLDALREHYRLTGTKKGCDQGQCGACTVLVDGERVLACLTLAHQAAGRQITTIEGLAQGSQLHPIQAAFVKHDALQCGYCTPGQICSAVGMRKELQRGDVSAVTPDVRKPPQLSREEIAERMSGNICRCGAYSNIVEALLA